MGLLIIEEIEKLVQFSQLMTKIWWSEQKLWYTLERPTKAGERNMKARVLGQKLLIFSSPSDMWALIKDFKSEVLKAHDLDFLRIILVWGFDLKYPYYINMCLTISQIS